MLLERPGPSPSLSEPGENGSAPKSKNWPRASREAQFMELSKEDEL